MYLKQINNKISTITNNFRSLDIKNYYSSGNTVLGNKPFPTPPAVKNIKENYEVECWKHNFPEPHEMTPEIFRDTSNEKVLGSGAGKNCCYKNPEYFSYHQYSFYDINFDLDIKRAILEKERDACRLSTKKGTPPKCFK